jgi:hypothetical protein
MHLEVGPIRMDSGHDSMELSRRAQSPRLTSTAVTRSYRLGAIELPGWPVAAYRALAGVAILLSIVLMVLAMVSSSMRLAWLPVPGLLLSSALFGTIATRVHRRDPSVFMFSATDESNARRILDWLQRGLVTATLEDIRKALNLNETSVECALHALVVTGRVDEDLDLDTGAWIYRVPEKSTQHTPGESLPVAERIRRRSS